MGTIATIGVVIGALLVAAVPVWLIIRFSSKQAEQKAQKTNADKLRSLMSDGKHLQAASKLIASGQLPQALDLLVSQGDFHGAGRVALRMQQPVRAAELFERAEDFDAAANAFLKIPDYRRAAQCMARAGSHEKAAQIYTQIGDLWTAADELVQAGLLKQAAVIHRQLGNDIPAAKLEGQSLQAEGKFLEAAQLLAQAGEFLPAAECLLQAGRLRDAARAFQQGGHPELAAAALEKAGEESEAARLYEEAGDHQAAARLYQRVRNPHKEVDALVSGGDILAAGHLAYKLGEKARAEEILLLATPADKGYARACFLLGRILEEGGRPSDALRYYALFVERGIPTDKTVGAYRVLAGMFEHEGNVDLALKSLVKLDEAGLLDPELRPQMEGLKRRATPSVARPAGATVVPVPIVDARDSVPDVLADRYKILRRLGEGGTAIVYLAHDQTLKRDVVLKFLSNPSLPGDLAEEYFRREAQIVAGISHPNIVAVYDVGNTGGRHYMIMEYIEGRTLEQVLFDNGRGLPPADVARMALELAEALEYAHDRKIIHRDLKPGNIMVLPNGHVKLMDFGMAKALEVHRNRSLYICGTPDYMSPEQETGFDLTPATDIYSFALVLMEALMGTIPAGPTAQAARMARLDTMERSQLSAPVQTLFAKCLSVDPEERPATARDVALGLAKALGIQAPAK